MTSATSNSFVDAIVIGGGLIGMSAALELRNRGMSVIVLEASNVARHASSASAGGVRSLNRHPSEIPLVRAALPLWAKLENELGQPCGFNATGQIRVAETAESFDALAARAAMTRELGYTHEQLIGACELHSRLPQLVSNCHGALLVEDDGFADPLATVHAYTQACINRGVFLQEGTRVQAIDKDAAGLHLRCEIIARNDQNDTESVAYRCHHCVNAAGAWGGVLSASAGEPVPLRPVALQMAVTEPLPHFVSAVIGSQSRKLSLKQTTAGAVIIGGGFEGQVREDRQHGLRGTLNHALAAENLANAATLFPHLQHVRLIRLWAGIEGMLSDSLPVLGQSQRLQGLIHAFGFSGHGFALVPLVGQVVADIAGGRNINLPIEAFAVDRFEQNKGSKAA